MTSNAIFFACIAFCLGSIPFSVLIGRLALHADIQNRFDRNPGATNVARVGGWRWGMLAIILDVFKATVPIAAARFVGNLDGSALVVVAVMPIFGHAFSPFLGFRGGKAVASTFGTWIALTIWEGPVVLGLALLFWFKVVAVDGWSVLLAMLSMLVYLILTPASINILGLRAEFLPTLLGVWVINAGILAWKHRADLKRGIVFRVR